ncbi:MAG: cell wall-binding protein, partial [Chloroflexota bacterium]|nr:cell wall-binding protein [Chloroflexota bacterium]
SIEGDGTPVCPPDYPIKGNATSRIYHQPGQSSYERTVAEFCFATEEDAIAAGFRAPLR